ncbi:MAG: hypothetical protein ACM31M_02750 [Nitrososphaerota archaeon]|jgi:hypothetical protein
MIPWKKITRRLPRVKRYADDRAPTIEEIRKIIEYPTEGLNLLHTRWFLQESESEPGTILNGDI